MASDGNQTPAWYGRAFPHLMYAPSFAGDRNESYHKAGQAAKGYGASHDNGHGHGNGYAAASKDHGGYGYGTYGAPTPSEASGGDSRAPAGTGTWYGPQPKGYGFTPDDLKKRAAAPAAAGKPASSSAAAPPQAASQASQASDVPIRGGGRMPLLGLGTYQVSSPDTVKKALELGYRHFDCASVYANEPIIGQGLAPFIAQSPEKRSELYIVSKVWNDAHRPAEVVASCEKSIKDLGCGYLDLYLIHYPLCWLPGTDTPDPSPTPLLDTWAAMESLVEKGLVKAIGVSNFSAKQLEDLFRAAKIKPAVNQVELSPYLSQRKLVGLCNRLGVQIVGFSPLGHGKPDLIQDAKVAAVAARHGKSPAQVLLRWGVQRGTPVIPKASSEAHLADNISGLFSWALDHRSKAELDSLECGRRLCDAPAGFDFGNVEEGGAAKPSQVFGY